MIMSYRERDVFVMSPLHEVTSLGFSLPRLPQSSRPCRPPGVTVKSSYVRESHPTLFKELVSWISPPLDGRKV